MTHPVDNQYKYGLCYDLNGQIVGFNLSPDVYICLTDEEIEKVLEAYAKQKHEREEDEEIKVGDEVQYKYSELTGIVTSIYKTKKFDILWSDGSTGQEKNVSDFKKTGRAFPQIVEVLKQMRENKND